MAKRIGILTGGGDCPGLNAVISSVVKSAIREGYECVGFKKGFEGLITAGGAIELNLDNIKGIAHLGGTILQTTNHGHFAAKIGDGAKNQIDPEMLERVKQTCERLDIEALVVIGGDGTLSTAQQLQLNGVNVIGVPKTIDNDLNSTDKTFGFSTGVEIIREGMARIHTTAVSHDRIFLVETMGRNVGWLALYGGIAGGADMILIPEISFSYQAVVDFIRYRRDVLGRNYAVIAVAEGARASDGERIMQKAGVDSEDLLGGVTQVISRKIEELAPKEFEIRSVVLGHLQRGGPPIAEDIILAERFGCAAVEAIKNKEFGKMVSLRGAEIKTIPLDDAIDSLKIVTEDDEIVKVAVNTGISFGK